MMVPTTPLCGRKAVYVDTFDLDYLYPYGYACCNDCALIVQSRMAWMDEFGNYMRRPFDDFDYGDYMEQAWGMDND